jgi:predicted MPP superfamily phosphohydrolase
MRNPELYEPVQIEKTLPESNLRRRRTQRRNTLILADDMVRRDAPVESQDGHDHEVATEVDSDLNSSFDRDIDVEAVSAGYNEPDTLMDESATAEEAPPKSKRGPSLVGRVALALSPLYTRFYDLQMQLGGGVRMVRHRVAMASYPRGVPPLKIAYLSDLHYGPTTGRVALRQAWQIARDANPDVLVLGGDFLYADESGLPALLRELQRWKNTPPPGGMYAVLGNHDHLADVESIITGLEACNVRVLVNDSRPLPEPWNDVWISGVDDMGEGDAQPELTLAGVPQGACSIMLSHSPDICEDQAIKRCGLTLCGHTHGGQICSPGGDAVYMPSKWGKHYPWGMHRHAGNWVFVSRGVGTVGLPLRLWAPPDVAILEVVGTVRSTVVA